MFVGVAAGIVTAALVALAASVVREGPSCRKGNALPDINALCACNPLPALCPHLVPRAGGGRAAERAEDLPPLKVQVKEMFKATPSKRGPFLFSFTDYTF